MSRSCWVVWCLTIAVCATACRKDRPPRTAFIDAQHTPVRISMADLHASGGLPPRWSFTLPAGDVEIGREVFALNGCSTCHVVAGGGFAETVEAGPELTGMGTHHPEVYFVESILNPNAILVEGEGYIGEDGRSNMPAYPDMTADDLTHLVAYLKSLVDPGGHPHAGPGQGFTDRVDLARNDLPAEGNAIAGAATPAPIGGASVFFVQTYSVRAGRLADLERWFRESGTPVFRSHEGLLELETYVDRTRGPESLITLFGFGDIDTLRGFLAEKPVAEALSRFDEYAETVDRQIYETRPVYRVGSLSAG